eukprot:7351307-Pyramimonas_sp.AAC.1
MYWKVCGLSHNDIQREFGKTPKALGLKPGLVPGRGGPYIFYAVERTPEFVAKYPTVKIFARMGSNVA